MKTKCTKKCDAGENCFFFCSLRPRPHVFGENGHRKRTFSKTLASRLRVDGRTELEVFEYDDVIHHTRLALRMFCGDAIGISTILAFSCGRAKTIRTRKVWTRIFFFFGKWREKKSVFKYIRIRMDAARYYWRIEHIKTTTNLMSYLF